MIIDEHERLIWRLSYRRSALGFAVARRGSAEWSWDNREGYREEIDALVRDSNDRRVAKSYMTLIHAIS